MGFLPIVFLFFLLPPFCMYRALRIFLAIFAIAISAFFIFSYAPSLEIAIKIIAGTFAVAILIYWINGRREIEAMQKRKNIVLAVAIIAAVLTSVFYGVLSIQIFAAYQALGTVFGLLFGCLAIVLEIAPKKQKAKS